VFLFHPWVFTDKYLGISIIFIGNKTMDQVTVNNPLSKHFRQPALYIKLTSGGKYWKEGALELPVTGELPVYPMTTKDEITLRTPDALINGTSVVDVIQSCCPNIKDAWSMPSVDVDSTLIAIRIASYGSNMGVKSKCPSCNEEHDYDINLTDVLAGIKMPDYSKVLTTKDGLVVKLRPMPYLQVSKAGNMTFEEEKLVQTLADPDIDPEVRKVRYDEHLKKMVNLNIDNITACTESITTEDGTAVRDPAFIKEYYLNSDSSVLRRIQELINEFAQTVGIRPLDVKCTDCENEFKLSVEFDYASFFGQGF
jgi:hypothetical protein